jgi:hypothetical protein
MSESKIPAPGQIGWIELTVPDAGAVQSASGIWHARGSNAAIPPAWIPAGAIAALYQAPPA